MRGDMIFLTKEAVSLAIILFLPNSSFLDFKSGLTVALKSYFFALTLGIFKSGIN